jgi:uncharacterized iron-regulated membrane protein
MRPLLVVVHRYVGLVMAGFLLVAGLTGSLLAWNDELEALISPGLFRVPAEPGAQALDPLVLRAMVAARYPQARITYAKLRQVPGHTAKFLLFTPVGARTPLPNDQVFVHPATGEILGERRWGDLSQGTKNLMPFVYRLHYSLALGTLGSYAFGIVALLWTLDCFVGAYLTFPVRAKTSKPWFRRWWPAWQIRQGSGSHKLNFDLHRTSGLWPWAMLFVLAWSSVAFNLTEVYKPTMSALVDYQPNYRSLPLLPHPQPEPGIVWADARSIGRNLMAQAAQKHGFAVLEEEALVYDPRKALYRYDVLSSLDPRDHGGATSLYFDANTGAQRHLWRPTGAAAGDTIRIWLAALHMAAAWGWPFKTFVCLLGLAIAVLSYTGVALWWKKRRSRRVRKV